MATLPPHIGGRAVPWVQLVVIGQAEDFGTNALQQLAGAAARKIGAPDGSIKDHIAHDNQAVGMGNEQH